MKWFKAAWFAYRLWKARRARRRARKLQKETSAMLEGKKTYLGIVIAALGVVLGWVGVGGEAEATQIVTHGAELVGLLIALYGRWAAKPK